MWVPANTIGRIAPHGDNWPLTWGDSAIADSNLYDDVAIRIKKGAFRLCFAA